MPEPTQRWAICPVEECEYAQEHDPVATAFCPSCGLELVSECPRCLAPLLAENLTTCLTCGAPLKE